MIDHRFIPGVTDAGKPRAAKGGFPYPGHGSILDQRVAKMQGPRPPLISSPSRVIPLEAPTEQQADWLCRTPMVDFWPAYLITADHLGKKFAGFASVYHDLFERRRNKTTGLMEYRLSPAGRKVSAGYVPEALHG